MMRRFHFIQTAPEKGEEDENQASLFVSLIFLRLTYSISRSGMRVCQVSTKTGEGLEEWLQLLESRLAES